MEPRRNHCIRYSGNSGLAWTSTTQAENRCSQVFKLCFQLSLQPQKKKLKFGVQKEKKKIKNNINISLYCTSGAFLQCFLTCFWKIQLQCLHSSFLLCMLCDEKPMHFRINMGLYRENQRLCNPTKHPRFTQVPHSSNSPLSKQMLPSPSSFSDLAYCLFFFKKYTCI